MFHSARRELGRASCERWRCARPRRSLRERSRTPQIIRKQSERLGKALVRFIAPAEVRKTSILTLENEDASDYEARWIGSDSHEGIACQRIELRPRIDSKIFTTLNLEIRSARHDRLRAVDALRDTR